MALIKKKYVSPLEAAEKSAVEASLLRESALDALADAEEQHHAVVGDLVSIADARQAAAASLISEANGVTSIATALAPHHGEDTIRSIFNTSSK